MTFQLKNSVALTALAAISFCLAGCETTNQLQLTTNKNVGTRLEFAKDNVGNREIQPQELNAAILRALTTNTRYPLQQWRPADVQKFSGIYTTQKPNGDIVAIYATGDIFNYRGGGTVANTRTQSNTQFALHVSQKAANTFAIDVDPNATQVNSTSPLGFPYKQLGPTDALLDDLQRILANPAGFYVRRYTRVEGEHNASYNPDSIYANFLRKLGRYSGGDLPKTNDIEKRAAYNFQVGREKVALLVTVTPYRNASKVMYSMEVPYTISGNGATTVSPEDISAAKSAIVKIVHD
jgi:hypothetical protein